MESDYEFEDIRHFFMKRRFPNILFTPIEHAMLRDRLLDLGKRRATSIRCFMAGYMYARAVQGRDLDEMKEAKVMMLRSQMVRRDLLPAEVGYLRQKAIEATKNS